MDGFGLWTRGQARRLKKFMLHNFRNCLLTLVACVMMAGGAAGAEKPAVYRGAACAATVDEFFANEVWAKVGAQVCLECHKAGGDAEDSDFILTDPQRSGGSGRELALLHNREAFLQMAKLTEGD